MRARPVRLVPFRAGSSGRCRTQSLFFFFFSFCFVHFQSMTKLKQQQQKETKNDRQKEAKDVLAQSNNCDRQSENQTE